MSGQLSRREVEAGREAQEGDHCSHGGACPADVRVWRPDGTIVTSSKIVTSISECLLSAQFPSLKAGAPHPRGCPQERTGASILSRSDLSGQTRSGPPQAHPWVITAFYNGINTVGFPEGPVDRLSLPGSPGWIVITAVQRRKQAKR